MGDRKLTESIDFELEWKRRNKERKIPLLQLKKKKKHNNDKPTNKAKSFYEIWVETVNWLQKQNNVFWHRGPDKALLESERVTENSQRGGPQTVASSSLCTQLISGALGSQWKVAFAVLRRPSPALAHCLHSFLLRRFFHENRSSHLGTRGRLQVYSHSESSNT